MKPIQKIGKYLPDAFPIQNDQKQGYCLSPFLFNVTTEYTTMNSKITMIERNTPASDQY
jgi:hypothetical protein